MADYSLADLRYFRAAARASSFVRGAEMAHVTPPAMSKAIARLELTLDAQLFVRAKRKVALTDAGRTFLRRAERILAEASEAEAELHGHSGRLSGELRIGAMEVFSVALLPRALAVVARAHPALITRSFEGSPVRIDRWVEQGEVDLGLAIGPVTREGLRSVSLGETPGLVVCGKTHPLFRTPRVTTALLSEHAFVVPTFLGEEGAPPIDQFPAAIDRKVGASIELLQMGIAMVTEGAWLGYFPEISIRAQVRRGELRALPIRGAAPFTLRATFRTRDQERGALRVALDALRGGLSGKPQRRLTPSAAP